MQCSAGHKGAAHVNSSKITEGTTGAEHTFGSRAFYLQEYVSWSTDLHASVCRTSSLRAPGLQAQGTGDKPGLRFSKVPPGNGYPAPQAPQFVGPAIKHNVQDLAGRCNDDLDLSDTHKVWVCWQLHSSCLHRALQTHDPGWHRSGALAPPVARNAGHSHTSLHRQLPTRCSYFVSCWTTHG